MDIADRKSRLNDAADMAGCDRVAWHGETGDTCPRCHVQVPAGYLLALPSSDVTGCLRCLEMQAHLFYGDLDKVPDDLAGSGGQQEALRLIAQDFRQYIKAAERGREPASRRASAARWAAHSGWESSTAWEPPVCDEPREVRAERWPKRPFSKTRPGPSGSGKAKITRRRGVDAPQSRGPEDILGLAGTPSRAEIIAAFRRSALVCHPDYGGSPEAFRELVAARDALLGEDEPDR